MRRVLLAVAMLAISASARAADMPDFLRGSLGGSTGTVNWQGFYVEAYVFAAAIYWCFCFFMSRYSQVLEREFNKGKRR